MTARFLPKNFRPIPDAELQNRKDMTTLVQDIARNQNWAWANLGGIFAADAAEPSAFAPGLQTASMTGANKSLFLAQPFAYLPSRTTGQSIVFAGTWSTSGDATNVKCRVRVYMLRAGELVPDKSSPVPTPYGEYLITTAGTDQAWSISFTARVTEPMLRLYVEANTDVGNTPTITFGGMALWWDVPTFAEINSTLPGAWGAISQAYVNSAGYQSLNTRLLRYLQTMTHYLVGTRRALIWAHSFLWNHMSSNGAATTRLAIYRIRADSIGNAGGNVPAKARILAGLVGQGAVGNIIVKVNGATVYTSGNTGATTLSQGVYSSYTEFTSTSFNLPAGADATLEVFGQVTVGAAPTDNSTLQFGLGIARVQIIQDAPTGATLALPGVETVPAAYQPLDDAAIGPSKSVCAQDDKLGNRVGPYYLAKNLIWLAANRGSQTLVGDWLMRAAVYGAATYYRATERIGSIVQGQSAVNFAAKHGTSDEVGWQSSAAYYNGTVLGDYNAIPVNAGRVCVAGRFYRLDPFSAGGAFFQVCVEQPAASAKQFTPIVGANGDDTKPSLLQASGSFASGTGRLRLQGAIDPAFVPDQSAASLLYDVACDGALIFELPRTQQDLDALA